MSDAEEKLIRARQQLRLTCQQAARKSGVGYPTLYNLEHGKTRRPHRGTCDRLDAFYGWPGGTCWDLFYAGEVFRFQQHGTLACYQQGGCRCELCRAAQVRRCNDQRRRRWGQEPPTHGASGYVNYGCRCDVCRAAGAQKNAQDRRRRKAGWRA